MNQLYLIFFSLCLSFVNLMSQSDWEYFHGFPYITDATIHNNKLYGASRTGLFILDLDSRESQFLNASNSNFKELGVREIEVMPNGDVWFTDYPLVADSLSSIFDLTAVGDELWFSAYKINGENIYTDSFGNDVYSIDDDTLINHAFAHQAV